MPRWYLKASRNKTRLAGVIYSMKPAYLLYFFLLPILLPLSATAQNNGQGNPFGNPGVGTALIRSSVMPADEAFVLSTFIEAPDTVVLLWEIEEGYYLYKKSIQIEDSEDRGIPIEDFPESESVTDEFFGESDVYFSRLLIRLPQSVMTGMAPYTVYYQGCAKDRYCYPMQSQELSLDF